MHRHWTITLCNSDLIDHPSKRNLYPGVKCETIFIADWFEILHPAWIQISVLTFTSPLRFVLPMQLPRHASSELHFATMIYITYALYPFCEVSILSLIGFGEFAGFYSENLFEKMFCVRNSSLFRECTFRAQRPVDLLPQWPQLD